MAEPDVLMEGIVFGESPRWHDGRLWFLPDGRLWFLPDGRLLVVDSQRRRVLRREPDGSLVQHAGLAGIADKPWNEIVADDHGNAYVNTIGFDFPGGEFAPGLIVRLTPDGDVAPVAGDLAFPNGMAISPDGATLIVAESYANRLTAYDAGLGSRRVWADLHGRRRRRLVRRRRQPALRPRAGRRRNPGDRRPRPRRLRLRAQPWHQSATVRGRTGLRQSRVIPAHRADRVIPRARTRRREALVKEARTHRRH
jgi:sugar lactone lactonase YvrE